MKAGVGLDELRNDTDLVAALLHAALEYFADTEFGRNIANVCVLVLVVERRGARSHHETRGLGQGMQNRFAQAVGQVSVCRHVAKVGEGQDGHRVGRRGRLPWAGGFTDPGLQNLERQTDTGRDQQCGHCGQSEPVAFAER